LPGNDDAGTMSAWYIFGASGIFPRAGSDLYLVGSPIFSMVKMHLPGGDLVIEAPNTGPRTRFVNAVTWQGNKLERPRITHAELAHGGSLRFTMGVTP